MRTLGQPTRIVQLPFAGHPVVHMAYSVNPAATVSASAPSSAPAAGGVTGWWDGLSTPAKVGVGAGAVLVVVLVASSMGGGRRRRRRRA